MLIWLFFHNSLPMISLRFARQIATSPSCSRCYLTNKDALHCLQDCRETKSIWDIIGFSNVAGFWCADVTDWIVQLASLDSAHLFFNLVCFGSYGGFRILSFLALLVE